MHKTKTSFTVDTYIEEVFLKKCNESSTGVTLFDEWKHRKREYCEQINTSIYEFMHFSLHDKSHSENILEKIELILGRKRIEDLKKSDLWLLLNTAYSHDIGMATEYRDLKDLWYDPEFLAHLKKKKESARPEEERAAKNYFYFEWLLNNGEDSCRPVELDEDMKKFEFQHISEWPLDFRRDITLLMSSFIRDRHATRSRAYFQGCDFEKTGVVPYRLYDMIGRINGLHMVDFSAVLEEEKEVNGIGSDYVHPRFIAVLLRLGDLLDLDNNRFDLLSVSHFGRLPAISEQHLKKHKAITSLSVSPEKVSAVASSEDFEVCRLCFSLFNMLEQELRNLITYWSVIAPKKLGGCIMGLPELKVYHGEYVFNNKYIKDFMFNKEKVLKLFTGNNLYESKLDFIREFVQNALDANRFQLWYVLRDSPIEKAMYLKPESVDLTMDEIRPFDIKKQAYSLFPVNLSVKVCEKNHNQFTLEISDEGIGLDLDGFDAIANVGSGWRKRESYTEDISCMRQWFKPTGGFGIGMQSAFMLTDRINIVSKSSFNCGYRAVIYKDSLDSKILIEEDNKNLKRGTTISFDINFETFLDAAKNKESNKEKDYYGLDFRGDFLAVEDKARFVAQIINAYVKRNFVNTLMPITVRYENGNAGISYQSEWVFKEGMGSDSDRDFAEVPEDDSSDYMKEWYTFDGNDKVLLVWNEEIEAFFGIKWVGCDMTRFVQSNYKGVRVEKDSCELSPNEISTPFVFNIMYDICGLKVDQCLLVSRNAYLTKSIYKEYTISDYIRRYTSVFFRRAIQDNEFNLKSLDIPYFLTLCKCCGIETLGNQSKINLEGIMSLAVWMKRDEGSNILSKVEGITHRTYFELLQNKCLAIASGEGPGVEITGVGQELLGLRIGDAESSGKGMITYSGNDLLSDVVFIDEPMIVKILWDYRLPGSLSTFTYEDPVQKKVYQQKGVFIQHPKLSVSGMPQVKQYHQEEKRDKGKIEDYFSRKAINYSVQRTGAKKFLPLLVNEIPYSRRILSEDEKIIITPYTAKTVEFMRKMDIKEVKKENLVQQVVNDPSFADLVKWVYNHQLSKNNKRYLPSEITEAYMEFVKLDFNEYINNK